MTNRHVKYYKKVIIEGIEYDVYIHSSPSKSNAFINEIVVEINGLGINGLSSDSLYTYITNKSTDDENKYISSVKEAFEDWLVREYKDKAVVKFNEWDGKLNFWIKNN